MIRREPGFAFGQADSFVVLSGVDEPVTKGDMQHAVRNLDARCTEFRTARQGMRRDPTHELEHWITRHHSSDPRARQLLEQAGL